jgi:hypothetical protein
MPKEAKYKHSRSGFWTLEESGTFVPRAIGSDMDRPSKLGVGGNKNVFVIFEARIRRQGTNRARASEIIHGGTRLQPKPQNASLIFF